MSTKHIKHLALYTIIATSLANTNTAWGQGTHPTTAETSQTTTITTTQEPATPPSHLPQQNTKINPQKHPHQQQPPPRRNTSTKCQTHALYISNHTTHAQTSTEAHNHQNSPSCTQNRQQDHHTRHHRNSNWITYRTHTYNDAHILAPLHHALATLI